MDPKQAIYADMLINKVVNLGLLNQLTNTTEISQSTFLSPISSHSTDSTISYPTQLQSTTSFALQSQPSSAKSYYEQAIDSFQNL